MLGFLKWRCPKEDAQDFHGIPRCSFEVVLTGKIARTSSVFPSKNFCSFSQLKAKVHPSIEWELLVPPLLLYTIPRSDLFHTKVSDSF